MTWLLVVQVFGADKVIPDSTGAVWFSTFYNNVREFQQNAPLILPFSKIPNQSDQLNCVCVVVVVGAISKSTRILKLTIFCLLLYILVGQSHHQTLVLRI